MQLLQHGKSFAVTGPSGTGKSTLVQHLLENLDANYYHGLYIHYGGLPRTALLKTVGLNKKMTT
jgi:ABC-type lipoprotein export system ATPase subunit